MSSGMRQYIICDLDGTLCDVRHREHHLQKSPPDWGAWNAGIGDDGVNLSVHHLLHMVESCDDDPVDIVFCTGREAVYKEVTQSWLRRNGIPEGRGLLMRATGNTEKDSVIKERMLTYLRANYGDDPLFVVDDRPSVIEMWERNGLSVFAVNGSRWKDVDTSFVGKAPPPTLNLMIGGSGVGKSTFCEKYLDGKDVVSSDHIREQILEDPTDMSKNVHVFAVLHKLVKTRLELGMNTFVDATNLRNRDRRALRDLAPEGVAIYYHVILRHPDRVKATAGWRDGVTVRGKPLVEYHRDVFESNKKDILDGDGDPRVTVFEHILTED